MVERGEMTVREAGIRGGTALRDKYGPEHFKEMGLRGSRSRREKLGEGGYKEWISGIARKGGQTTASRHELIIIQTPGVE